jgi:hypothetical protein
MMNVYFTVDTESSMADAWDDRNARPLTSDRHIFCRIGAADYGIGLITETLGRHGFRATFFVEPLVALVNGEADTRQVYDYLLRHDQDVQLHIHPSYQFFAEFLRTSPDVMSEPSTTCDLLSAFDEAAQSDLLARAVALHKQLSGTQPVAFRAGCFAADSVTLRCLRREGILFDTSFNPCYRTWSFPGEDLNPNEVRSIEGVWEIPVTVARTPIPEGYGGLKHADPCALSFVELRDMLEHGEAQGQQHFVIVFHSFSAVKPRDVHYTSLKPDRITIKRLQRLVRYLSDHPERYRVATFGDLAREKDVVQGTSPVASLSMTKATVRKSVQVLNRSYWF